MTAARPMHVVLVPGSDARPFDEDIAHAAARGIAAHPLTLPPFQGHPIEGRAPYFRQIAEQIHAAGEAILRATPEAALWAIGRNNGGGLLAHAAATGLFDHGVVLTGAIPEMTQFRLHADHESARAFRASLDGPDELAKVEGMQGLDVVTSLQSIPPERCFIQVGSEDPWMNETAFAAFHAMERTFQVQWLPDDHAMVSPAAIAGRWDFIAAHATGA